MTEAVHVEGFAVPGGAVQPKGAVEGFVVPPLPVAVLPAVAAPVAPAAGAVDPAMAAAIAALTAALPTAAAADAQDSTGTSLNVIDPSTIEDPTLRSMASAFKSLGAGLDLDRVFAKAIDVGDASLLDMAYLREKAGANADALAGLAESIIRVINKNASGVQDSVHALAGGAPNWNAATAAFNKDAPPEFKLAISQMLDSGKEAQITAAAKLVVQFAKGQGYVSTPATLLNAGGGAATAQALDKEGFQAELRKLNPNDQDFSTKRGELFVRRSLGKQLGKN